MSDARIEIPSITEKDGREHARAMYLLLGHELCGLTELRALGNRGPWVAYVDNAESFVDLAFERNRVGDHVYVGLQPRPVEPFGTMLNTWRPARGGADGNVARANDIEFVTAVALDIDVDTSVRRDGRPASNEELEACVEVAQSVLKLEGFVGTAAVALSGNGVYVINPITPVEIDSDTASALKAMERHWIAEVGPLPQGARIDPIMDLPRIIRVIGTVNYKGTPGDGRPHRRSCFLALPVIGGRQNLLAEQLRYVSASDDHTDRQETRAELRLARGDMNQFEACEFVKWIGRNAAAIPEPAWMDFLTQCGWLEGGDEVAHRLSERDPARYTRHETQARLDRIRRTGYRPKPCSDLSGSVRGRFDCRRFRMCPATRPIELAARRYEMEVFPMDEHTTTDLSKAPKHVLRCGGVSATTWSNTRTVNGELREHVQVELVKNYRDADGAWCKTSRFWPEDLPAVAVVAQKVFEALRVSERWPAATSEGGEAGANACPSKRVDPAEDRS